jgi:hypothetical protein
MLFQEIIRIYSESHMKLRNNTLCGRSAVLFIIKAGGRPTDAYSFNWALRVNIILSFCADEKPLTEGQRPK